MARRPTIAVTAPDKGGRMLTWLNWLAIRRAGGRPVIVRPGDGARFAGVDGILIGGGEDISPVLYDDKLRLEAVPDKDRDKLELAGLETADKKGLPVFGICRGMQLINVYRGGTLNPESYADLGGANRHRTIWAKKLVRVEDWSDLFRFVDTREEIRVNCLHHQAVDRVGDGLKVCAQDSYDITQGIEDPGDRFLAGVQWHPEILVWRSDQVNIFRGLVASA